GGIGSAGRNQAPAVGAEGQTRYPGRGRLEGMDLVSGGRVVEGDPAGQADGQELAVPTEADGGYPLGAGNGSQLRQGLSLRRRQVPELNGVVPTGGSEGSVVGRKGHGNGVAAVAAQGIAEGHCRRGDWQSVRGIGDGLQIRLPGFPDLHRVVETGG